MRIMRNILITVSALTISFGIGLVLDQHLHAREHIETVFVFAVFLVSLLTDGYVYGITAAFLSVIAVNYAFTFPYFALNFSIPANFISAVIMIVLAVLTGALTTKIKRHELMKAESERERMHANLLRAVSHDLRTPLTTICGSAATLIEQHDSLSEAQQMQILQGIREDSDWLTRMVENLLSITRINTGQVKLIKTPTVLDELMDSVLVKFRKRYPAQAVQVELPEEIVVVPMDAILIEQVLLNLLENACRHATGMSSLLMRVYLQDVMAVFEVSDDGCGIPEEDLSQLFTGYYERKNEPPDGHRQNSGIGLSVCATIVRAHGGTIGAENRPEGGTTFRFTLITEAEEEQDDGINE